MAVDRQLIVDSLYHGRTRVPNGFQMKLFGDMWIKDYPGVPYDPDQGARVGQEVGL